MSNNDIYLQSAIDNILDRVIDQSQEIISLLARQVYDESFMRAWLETIDLLGSLVPDDVMPPWLVEARENFKLDIDDSDDKHLESVANFIVKNAPQIYQPILIDESASIDVEEVFRTQAQKVDLGNIFENLVSLLSEIIAKDVIEHRTVQEAIIRLQVLLRRNKYGSLASTLMTMNFGRFFINSFKDTLRANKYTKLLIDNFEKEFVEACEIVDKTQNATNQEIISRLTNSERLKLFIESNPDTESIIAGFLPPAQFENGEDVEQES